MSVETTTLLVPYRGDPLAVLIDSLFATVAPPDFSRATIVLANGSAANDLRRQLLHAAHVRGHAAIRPPFIGTLAHWLDMHAPDAAPSDAAQELILHYALRHAHTSGGNRWGFIANVRTLLHELGTYGGGDLTHAALDPTLAGAYGIRRTPFAPLTREARYIAELWAAWRTYIGTETMAANAYRQRLDAAAAATVGPIYLVGFTALTPAEAAWRESLATRTTSILHGRCAPDTSAHPDATLQPWCAHATATAHPADDFSDFLESAYSDSDTPMAARAAQQRQRAPASPARVRLGVYAAVELEQEAHGIALQIRRWWLADLRRIGIVTHDRVLARRVRALLERAGIGVRDAAGWPLSTTSAATVIMRWLDALADDFEHAVLADVLRSPFAFTDCTDMQRREWVAWWQRDIVARSGSLRGLARFEATLKRSAHAHAPSLLDLLARVRTAANAFTAARAPNTASAWLAALHQSLQTLGILTAFAGDAAGRTLVDVLTDLHSAAQRHDTRLDATEFRAWLEHNFERHYFYPPAAGESVELLGFAQSRLRRFDAIAIAGLSAEFPGAASATPFFNDRVRRQLGLPTALRAQQEQLYDYRRLLEAAPRVLLTYRQQAAGQRLRASAWVERLQLFHRQAYGDDLSAHDLAALASHPETALAVRDAALPTPPKSPRPSLPADLIPLRITPQSYQNLLDCPYKFFAQDVLGLRAPDDATDAMEKSDYGRTVHRILEAFHRGGSDLPAPFAGPVTAKNAAEAEQHLRTIARAAFAPAIERHFFAHGWLHRFECVVPAYIKWEAQRGARWQPAQFEHAASWSDPQSGVTVSGRLDRIDSGADGIAIIDYKTGAVASGAELRAGESAQLPLYALLAAQANLPVTEAVLLQIDGGKVNATAQLAAPELTALAGAMATRLTTLWGLMAQGAELPAWGDDTICARCDFAGLCRKSFWPLPASES